MRVGRSVNLGLFGQDFSWFWSYWLAIYIYIYLYIYIYTYIQWTQVFSEKQV